METLICTDIIAGSIRTRESGGKKGGGGGDKLHRSNKNEERL